MQRALAIRTDAIPSNRRRSSNRRSPDEQAAQHGASDAGSPGLIGDTLQPAIRIVMMPRDVNYLGTIFGGVILSSIDLAGAVEAHRHSNRKLVTAALHEVKFIAPVFVGDLVSFYAEMTKIGNTSITVRVTVEARRAIAPHELVRVTQAEVVYVAIGGDGKPVSVHG